MLTEEMRAALGSLRGEALFDEMMREHTSWRIGGPADCFAVPADEADIRQIFAVCRRFALPWMAVGRGSNLLVGDTGFRGVLICIGENFADSHWQGMQASFGAGMLLFAAAREAAARGAAGLAWAAGIPGSMGGAVRMNAGAFGGSMADLVTKVDVVEYDGTGRSVSGEALDLSYRHSFLSSAQAIATRVHLQFQPGERSELEQEMKEHLAYRSAKQPLELPSAGSVFKNPPGSHAGYLVEQAGCKGMQEGMAQVSPKHGNFIVNLGGARAVDVLRLIERVQARVRESFGVELEPEVRIVGE